MATTLRAPAQTITLGDRVSALVATARAAYARHRVYRQTVSELVGLSDRDLADLGLHRSHIRAIAREHAYGK
ncbi:MAG: DUF1127 domain-containing protein [Pseudooceanicola sp.]|nr:DUF1127 domain-containing protein [Pseudooceanicola sp.]